MLFLGIDQSLRSTGLAIINEKGECLRTHTVFTKNMNGPLRLNYIREEMKSFIVKAENDFKDSVKASAMEGISFGSVHRGIDLGGIFAILQTELYMLGVDPLVVAPSQVKKYATGNAKAEKLQMINSAKISFGAKVNNDNEADAVILANISRSFCTSAPLDDRPKLEVMKALRDKADDTKMRVPTKRKSREPNI